MHEIIVIDTSVLIALEKLNILDLICKIYKKILIPQAVLKEYGSQLDKCFEVIKINDIRLLEIIKELNLGKGESEVIVIAFENNLKRY
jgi:predicted nucleic acid-binding protein